MAKNNSTWCIKRIEDKMQEWKNKMKEAKYLEHLDEGYSIGFAEGMEVIIEDLENILYD